MKDVDVSINKHNLELYKNWGHEENVTFEVKNDLTGKTITVSLVGDFITCKNCRDKILSGFTWHQGAMERKMVE